MDTKYDPPLGLLYLASMLEHSGFDVTVENLAFTDTDKWVEKLKGYDVYGFTVYTPILNEVVKLIRNLDDGNTKFIAGGPHATSLPEETLEEGFDAVVVGEGEYALPRILKMNEFPQIVNARRIEDLDALPYPARHLIPIKEFHREVDGVKSTGLISTRGCPYRCAFCSKDVHGRLRLRSPSNVIGEIEEIFSTFGIRALHFYDDTFTIRPFDQLKEICSAMKRRGIVYRCTGNLRRDDEKTLRLLYDTGCREYCVGVESGSQKVLNAVRKGTTVKRNLEVIKTAKRIGLPVKAFFMVGCPGETEETVRETIRFIEEARPDRYSVFSFVPYPDCDIYKHPGKYGVKIKSRDYHEYCMVAAQGEGRFVVETEELNTEQIATLYQEVRRAAEGLHGSE